MLHITAGTVLPFLQHLPTLRTSRLQDYNRLSAALGRCTPVIIKQSTRKAFGRMALARGVGAQPDWHGQDCFMGIGGISQLKPTALQKPLCVCEITL